MKDLYGLADSGIPEELVAKLTSSSRNRKIAEALLAQSLQPVENMGGQGASISWTQGLDKMLRAYLGRRGMDRAAADEQAVAGQVESGRQSAMEAYLAQKRGQPGVPYVDATGAEGEQGMTSGVAGDPRRAIEDAQLNSYLRGSPFIAGERQELARTEQREDQQSFLKSQAEENRKFREAQAAADRETKMQMLQDRLAAEERAGRDSRETKLLIAQLGRGMRQEPAPSITQIVDPTNPKQMLSINAREYKGGGMGSPGVVGIAGKEPAAAKQAEGIDAGRATVSELVGTLRGYYDALAEAGDIADPSQGAVANTLARVQSSAVGQAVGSALGTKSQSQRESIEMTRPLLLNAIRSATGMSARQMDSNRELQLYLAAATDPTKGYSANIRALEMLDKLYGIGGGAGGAKPAAKAPAGVPDQAAIDAELKRRGL